MSQTIVGFGEIMGRIEPNGYLRLRQAMPGDLRLSFAGAEANVMVSLQMLGRDTRYVTGLPVGPIGDAAVDAVRRFGIDVTYVVRDEGRLGLYFVETGANQRPTSVIYDRDHSIVSRLGGDAYAWADIFEGAEWFHVSGITPAVSPQAAEATQCSVEAAKKAGVTVSCDLNFRKKLWRWDSAESPRSLAEKTMRKILPFTNVVIGNEEDAWDILRIKAGDSDVEGGRLAIDRYPDVAGSIIDQFPNVSTVAITLRESISASHNNWGAMLFDGTTNSAWFAPMNGEIYQPYEIRNIVDRVGGGDSFAAGLIYGLTDDTMATDLQAVVDFATAASCLCHSVQGDFNYSSVEEITTLMNGATSGRVER